MGRRLKINYKKGYTLLELIIAMAIFVIMMLAVTSIFGKSIKAYNRNKIIQRDMETAQQSMNFIAKVLRTSTVTNSASSTNFVVYDYSQTGSKCINFVFSGNAVSYRTIAATGDSPPSCPLPTSSGWSTYNLVDTTIVSVQDPHVSITPSNGSVVGKITISFRVCPPTGCTGNDQVRIQSSVSLRDYQKTNINL